METINLQNVHLAARLYYIDNLPQSEIARSLHVSQAKVSRLLTEARERGIVRISVADFDFRDSTLETKLVRHLGILSAIVVRTAAAENNGEQRKIVAHLVARAIADSINANHTVAVSGGRTLCEVARHLPSSHKNGVTVLPAMGSVRAQIGTVDAVEVARTIANHCGASVVMLNSPAFLPDKKTRDTFLALEQIRSVRSRLSQANLALVGIGTLSNSVFIENKLLTKAHVEELHDAGVVGEICGRFFDKNGTECDTKWRDRVVSIEFSQLRRIPNVTAIVLGEDRVQAIRAAAAGQLIKSLVTDERTAMALLDSELNSSSGKTRKRKV